MLYDNDQCGVQVNLLTGSALDGWGDTDTLSNIEDVFGSAYYDTIIGDGGINLLRGLNGNDTIYGGGGNDELRGNAGDDVAARRGWR